MAEKKKRDFEKIIRRRLSVVKMGVHTQGESGFFDDDPDELPAMVQNESIEQHETANATVGKCHMFPTHTHTQHTNLPGQKKRKENCECRSYEPSTSCSLSGKKK